MAQNRWMLFVVVVLSFLLCSCGNVYYTVRLKKTGDDAYRGKAVEGAVIGTKAAETLSYTRLFWSGRNRRLKRKRIEVA